MSWFAYVGQDNDEIAVYEMDPASAELTPVSSVRAGRHPSFLAFSPSKKHVYAVNEFSDEVAAFAVDASTGALSLLNRVPSRGKTPAFVSVDASGTFAMVANYDGENVAVFALLPDGRLGETTDTRTTGKHPHDIRTDRSNRFVFVPNKGSDTISQFSFDRQRGRLVPARKPELELRSSAEPRHIAFHPDGVHAFAIEEGGCHMHSLALDDATGELSHLGVTSLLPPGSAAVGNTGSELQLAPSGRFLYGSNRGHDSIVIYSVDPGGALSLVGHESTRGKAPRHFSIDPSGKFLFAANKDSNTVSTFRLDPARGTLALLRTLDVPASPHWVGAVELP